MKMSGGPASVNFKIFLLIVAILIAAGTLFYTQNLVQKLQEKEKQIVELYARGIEYIANTTDSGADLTFLFENIIRPIDFPLVITDANDALNLVNRSEIRNVRYDTTLSQTQLRDFFEKKIKEMDEQHNPILVAYADSIILQKIHYGDSDLIERLQYYPYLQILIAALFIILGYIGFSNIKKSEQSNIWVGMAKETAHQFGTPISSLMGWIEMLKMHYHDKDRVLDITNEITDDVEKLNKITYRFSKIGAVPELKKLSVYDEIYKVKEYFARRLPQLGKSVEIILQGDKQANAELNSELFEWVIENLIKNALDAIDHKQGKIEITVKEARKEIEIDVADNGKGIDLKRRKDIFRPGYSTKRRGWGLGLSLSKRIIEVYHKGKIFVKNSVIGEGTTIKIILKKS
ncbi:MAG: two-component sensor histidine kinase [Ignavibacteria bacterium RIFOXYB2_FULL_35_12]|nr:MAG: two-component sensor histidine kinase [Ignavibacteria bacterium GWA2_36_19]OGU55154.1 MAG: two-component sensor histidine kinase [Ignavibacteria bacterium GWC2_35_8]OGU58608.1 MAG: two-component sensor histidine kinase [Ignavibacteria bacterium GWF2_35_20]OGU81160.1 MAG: two-component sensor histidine kinase [Ignavibacteria bacterium RIFOXYA2_FULL_35_9]OGU87085.1 MAG: two-component sensor histidine kinase [Ignavibacteria bacterium RIFOXYA12_FULL_35_25]OGU92400.1 MAG: two-component sens